MENLYFSVHGSSGSDSDLDFFESDDELIGLDFNMHIEANSSEANSDLTNNQKSPSDDRTFVADEGPPISISNPDIIDQLNHQNSSPNDDETSNTDEELIVSHSLEFQSNNGNNGTYLTMNNFPNQIGESIRPARTVRGVGFPLTNNGKIFMKKFYKTILRSKKNIFPKYYVKEIHDKFIARDLNISKMSRENKRSIRKYFCDFAQKESIIIPYLSEKREIILSAYPILRNY